MPGQIFSPFSAALLIDSGWYGTDLTKFGSLYWFNFIKK